jgi:beta-mannosidase
VITFLHHGWTVRPTRGQIPDAVTAAGGIPATVPGTVHTDLLAAGLVPDPYLDDHERLLAWIGLADWRYERFVAWEDTGADRVDLVFEGLDTVAEVTLNARKVARTRNMHRTHRIDVTDGLRGGANHLGVEFASAVRYADGASLELGARPHVNHHPYNAIRKMACNFGWDWGPDLVTAGIWRPVYLHTWDVARLAAVRPVVGVSGTRGTVDVHVDVERTGTGRDLLLRAAMDGARAEVRIPAGETSGIVRLEVPGVELWWPRGHGGQPLHDLRVMLALPESGAPLQEWSRRIAFRTLEVDIVPDDAGTPFAFIVNGRRIFVKGANWIPDDVFPARVTRERYAARLAQAEAAGINLLRVWGGGCYESDDFYTECDERGLLVWQDFLFACAAYAEEDPLRSEVIAEARENVTRLMPHPSLVLWNGGNENIWGHADWGWQSRLDGRTWGMGYYSDVLPAVVAELDPGRPYLAGSPWSLSADRHPNDPAHGTMHIWDVWNHADYTGYRSHRPRFAAEFGWQGPPTWSTLRRAISDDPLTPESPGMLAHQKAVDGNQKLTGGLVPHLPVPDDMEDWHWAMSLNQARAVRTGVEHFRALSPHCAGSVVWQLNDCWPVTSWAMIDGDGRRKPVFYALRGAHADRLVTVQPRDGGLVAAFVNDTPQAWRDAVVASRRTYDGKLLDTAELTADVPPWSAQTVELPPAIAAPGDPAGELVVVEAGALRGFWFYAEDRESDLPPPGLEAVASAVSGGYRVRVTATALVRDAALLADKVAPDAVVDDMLVTLLPGETVTWHVATAADIDPLALLTPNVLRCANQLVAGRTPGPRGGPQGGTLPG